VSILEAHITPSVLRWAREVGGYTAESLAKELRKGVTTEIVQAWEDGIEKPRYTDIKKLADIYKRPVALFYLPEPPEEEDLGEKFRSLPGKYINELPPRIRILVRKARVRQLNIAELNDEGEPKGLAELNLFRRMDLGVGNVKQIANAMRDKLGVTLNEQQSWQKPDEAFKIWRAKLEDFGIWIFKDSFRVGLKSKDHPEDDYDGFYLADEWFPVIYINNNKSHTRQIFTLFHELAHFLLSKGGICFRRNIERDLKEGTSFHNDEYLCNAFTGEFLVPDDDLNLTEMPSDREIEEYANIYKVSREVILRKCLNRGLVDWNEYNRITRGWNQPSNNTGGDGGSYYLNQRAYLGNKYLNLVFSQYYKKRISEAQAADCLGVKVTSLPGLEAFLYEGSRA